MIAVNLPVLDNIRIASPCNMSWNDMSGDARVRQCEHCKLNVFNLSEMTRSEAETLIREKQGHLCVRYYQRADGTILTADCPVGLAAARAALVRTASRIAAVASAIFAAVTFGGSRSMGQRELSSREPFASIAARLNPRPVPLRAVMGDVCVMPPKPAPGPSQTPANFLTDPGEK